MKINVIRLNKRAIVTIWDIRFEKRWRRNKVWKKKAELTDTNRFSVLDDVNLMRILDVLAYLDLLGE